MPADDGQRGFDYAAYFARIKGLERLTLNASEIAWREKYEPPQDSVDVLLYLGCNVLITSHLAIEVVAVLKHLGINFEAIGGPQFCCGIVHHSHGDLGAADRLSSATIEKMLSYGAKTLVMWCPSCDLQFEDVIIPSLGKEFGLEITHATQFLADRANEMPFRVPVRSRVAVHTHVGYPRQDRDARTALSLLKAIPGVEIVGVVSSQGLGYHCPTPPSAEARRAFMVDRERLLGQATALRADTVVTLYHSCQREWCAAHTEALKIRNYISIVAESLGCGADDRYTKLRLLSNAAEIVDASAPQWTSHGWDTRRATDAATSLHPPETPRDQPTNG